ncbi:ATP-binding cassette domain-containing protein [Actinoplanes rectilineatus]|uniref:ATP-binding cassette domain-containing protein n=1 Tax=Actinoplanes rectilineatus TaxID=113571 RepID=UPI0005F2D8AB|nr:ATP-binding cassette domain-containing protein [Actinoplanes rectilineatus]
MNVPLLHLHQLSRRYGAVTALHPISLQIPAGARHAIIGPNGAGKSTLLNLIAGSQHPSGGTVTLDNRPVTQLTAAARARHGISRTFQHPAVIGELTAAGNLALAARTIGRRARAAERRRRVQTALTSVHLDAHAGTPARALSYGQQRRLELAMALTARPRLLLLDEPSAGLDPSEIAQLTTTLRGLPPEITVLLVDHHLPLVFDVATTITVLAAGQHLVTGTADEIRADTRVAGAYFATPTASTPRTPRTGGQAVLSVNQLRAGYRGAPVLTGVDLEVAGGTVHALLGRNGAGKTTLLNVLAGLHPALPGSTIAPAPGQRQAGSDTLALVPQGRRLWPTLTVAEHLNLAAATGARRTGHGHRFTHDDIWSLLPALDGKQHRYPGQMSGGEQQMLAMARALLLQPRLLLLDEPTEGLAPRIVDHLAQIIARIADDGVAVLLAEQNQQFTRTVADRISVLDAGRIAFSTHDMTDPDTHTRLADYLGVSTAGTTA